MTLDEKSFQNFGEYLYYAYANLEMLHYALKADKPKCYHMIVSEYRPDTEKSCQW